MKVTYNWLKDFVQIKLAPQALAEKLTMAGLEVVSLEEKDGDWVLEIEITSNRPDWLSVAGIAREVAALTNVKCEIRNTKSETNHKSKIPKTKLEIKIEDKKDCPLYTARVIQNVKVAQSPGWMRKRLELVGIRPVNNIVDITNYVLLETGEPLHAFDLDKLAHQDGFEIAVRRARNGEKIMAIDGKERTLDKDILVIADSFRPVAVAGVIGGKDTEVGPGTKNILLEAAKFSPVLIRRGRQKLGISTESSYRFERDVDMESVNFASLRAGQMIQKEAGGGTVLFLSQSKAVPKCRPKPIKLDVQKVKNVLGVEIPVPKIKNILGHLGLKVKTARGSLEVSVPSFRRDLLRDVDLIEEVCRIHGYGLIPVTTPCITPQVFSNGEFDLNFIIRNILIAEGLNEVITHSLINEDLLERCAIGTKGVFLDNPLSKELEMLRPTLIPSFLNVTAHNLNRKLKPVRIFEIAKRFLSPEKEEYVLTISLCAEASWCGINGKQEEKMSLLHLKGVIENLLERLGVGGCDFSPAAHNAFYANAAFALKIGNSQAGIMGQVRQEILNAFDIKNQALFLAEINLGDLYKVINLNRRFMPLPAYPAVTRDISILVGADIGVQELSDCIEQEGQPFIKEVKVADFYAGEHIPKGSRGLTFSCLYQSAERTLQDDEVNGAHQKILENLKNKFGAKLR
ncbi:MAG: phenylalanine--tRNA ligase subunit beta [Candidatus Omnitrophica bacterium]|nr:phenylalanine--tRNA ligase subunit beta [Candidatus Omnitrophota bacterium]MDD5236680.1 phenylalanine--tRNA ligase subunit beta [Candidatus Omnitrophota bacterium]MDD5610710.1 phenylalanine--tRNA ligase subunit beta [Candidatus Omnitrophota bacterium]